MRREVRLFWLTRWLDMAVAFATAAGVVQVMGNLGFSYALYGLCGLVLVFGAGVQMAAAEAREDIRETRLIARRLARINTRMVARSRERAKGDQHEPAP